jgi:CubicO group peptidase (beta-lactamase class C family)
MRLVQEGRLGLDEPVLPHLGRWRFPGSEQHRDQVTARHLLSHTAGIDDGFGFRGFLPGETPQTAEESLTLPQDTTADEPHGVLVTRAPGAALSYSSAGYTVLQLLVEEVSGRPFASYMREAVLQPLGMSASSFDLDAIEAEGRGRDLAPNYDRKLEPQPPRRYTAQAAVGLRATAHDLARLCQAYFAENPVVSGESVEQMLTPQPGTSGIWGLGHELYAGSVAGHSGGVQPASGASLRVHPATGDCFVLLVAGGRGGTNRLAHDWTWWETGVVTPEARLQVVQDRAVPAVVAIVAGAVALVIASRRRF